MTPDPGGRRILITGGAGFIGSSLVERALRSPETERVAVLDALTYAANPLSLEHARQDPRFSLHEADLCATGRVRELLAAEQPEWFFHLAAETHVDRSIDDPLAFVRANVDGTAALLLSLLEYWESLPAAKRDAFRFVHASTDEVFGSLAGGEVFHENSAYAPSSPYSASKAASDHLVRSFERTYGLPALITWSCNNYGPRQFPEKLVPLMALKAIAGEELPVYGRGEHVRDWIHVDDHCAALLAVAGQGDPHGAYCIGAGATRTNAELVAQICDLADAMELTPAGAAPSRERIRFVADRPGHDLRYALDWSRLQEATGWRPRRELGEGLTETLRWYAENSEWTARSRAGGYRGERLGLPRQNPRAARG